MSDKKKEEILGELTTAYWMEMESELLDEAGHCVYRIVVNARVALVGLDFRNRSQSDLHFESFHELAGKFHLVGTCR
jgi:hypothetical protein